MDRDLQEILAREEDPFLWRPYPGPGDFPIWPMLRFEILTQIFYRKKKDFQAPSVPGASASWWRKKIHTLQALGFDPLRSKDGSKEVLFFTKGKSLKPGSGGEWRHPYADRLIGTCPNRTLLVEKSHAGRMRPFGRPCHFRSYEAVEKRVHGLSRPRRNSAVLAGQSEDYARRLAQIFDISDEEKTIAPWKERIHETAAKIPAFEEEHKKLFARWDGKVAVMEDAHYGDMALLVRAANRAGLVTAELQHGILDENHTAYAMSESTRSRLQNLGMLPQAFLVWGSYWGRKLGPGIPTVAVGKDMASPPQKPSGNQRKPEPILLVISSGCSVALLRELLPFLSRETHKLGWSLRIRPHPSEKPFAGRIFPETPWMEFDPHEDLADSLAEAAVVFGDFSTALYEAAEAGRPVIIWENEGARLYSDPALGQWVRTTPELVSLLQEGFGQKKNLSSSAMVEPGGLENYRNFLRSSGVSLP